MNSEGNSPPKALSTLGIVSALFVGLPLWHVFLIFLGDNPLGKADGMDFFVAFAPIIGFSIPIAFSQFHRFPGLALWALAIAPVLSVVNFVACIFITANLPYRNATLFVLSALWAIPLVKTVRASIGKL